jgi:hypothetical protein
MALIIFVSPSKILLGAPLYYFITDRIRVIRLEINRNFANFLPKSDERMVLLWERLWSKEQNLALLGEVGYTLSLSGF